MSSHKPFQRLVLPTLYLLIIQSGCLSTIEVEVVTNRVMTFDLSIFLPQQRASRDTLQTFGIQEDLGYLGETSLNYISIGLKKASLESDLSSFYINLSFLTEEFQLEDTIVLGKASLGGYELIIGFENGHSILEYIDLQTQDNQTLNYDVEGFVLLKVKNEQEHVLRFDVKFIHKETAGFIHLSNGRMADKVDTIRRKINIIT